MEKEQVEAVETEVEDEELKEIEAEFLAIMNSKSVMAERP